ncbi:desmoglein-2.1-like isoform X1 [Synchiropus splendidus]|uniref:desmoglein-2.1-like isoform X1 n=2 Tax=Synchiropus splendidus TaxID=270530 RepID=UPI00237E5BB2|nr:desmoglein-2.1-like isoform X1 [Synchiropus splendidus]
MHYHTQFLILCSYSDCIVCLARMQLSAPTCLTLLYTVCLAAASGYSGPSRVRRKRAWIMRPKVLKENTDYSHQEFVVKIRSDLEEIAGIVYSLQGIGANDVFHVNSQNGYIKLSKTLDREHVDSYHLVGVASFRDGTVAEKVDILIKVLDENDNSPVFAISKPVSIDELSSTGTFVAKANATDADEPGNPNSQIKYSILSEDPPEGMFYITGDGHIHVNKPLLDRERQDRYILKITGQDLSGSPGGNTATGTVTINVLDVNDNPPTFEKATYEINIEENSQGIEVLRIKTEDLDQRNTVNWEAVYDIVKGNEAEHFSIHTDLKTNEGVLILDKPADFENVKELKLVLAVRNRAPIFHGPDPRTRTDTCSVIVHVINQVEGPYFDPEVKVIPIGEGGSDINIKDVIARYAATNEETKRPAENVRYLKGSDPDNWLIIDPATAEIKLNKLPDRESPFLINGTYYAKVLCVSNDMPPKTATGTLAIQVEDSNDNCPTLTTKAHMMCINKGAVFVQAHDEDLYPNGPPFQFTIVPEGTQGKWETEHLNDTTVILRALESTWPGSYKVQFLIQDEQGHACPDPQILKVSVCTCEDGVTCGKKGGDGQPSKDVSVGTACIGLVILGLLLLLLLPLILIVCKCGHEMNNDIPCEGESYAFKYNSEGPGENTAWPLIIKQTKADVNSTVFGTAQSTGQALNNSSYQYLGEEVWVTDKVGKQYSIYNNAMDHQHMRGSVFERLAVSRHFLGEYFTQKVNSGNDYAADMDSTLEYHFEGQGSPAGSVGCCSLLMPDNELHFLDDLNEPEFKKLAEVCSGFTAPTKVKMQTSPDLRLHSSSHMVGSTLSDAEHTFTTEDGVVKHKSECSQAVKENLAVMTEGISTAQTVTERGQVLLLQQPIYYASNPVMQPVHYVVQPQVQATMVLTEAPATHLQSMVLASEAALRSTANAAAMVLLEGSQQQENCFNLIQPEVAQTMMVTESKAAGRPLKVKNNQSKFVSGGRSEASGFQRVQMVEGCPSTGGNRTKRVESLSPKRQVSASQRRHQQQR